MGHTGKVDDAWKTKFTHTHTHTSSESVFAVFTLLCHLKDSLAPPGQNLGERRYWRQLGNWWKAQRKDWTREVAQVLKGLNSALSQRNEGFPRVLGALRLGGDGGGVHNSDLLLLAHF